LTERTSVTADGGVITYYTGTDSAGTPVSYTKLPFTDASYVPTPSSYATPSGYVTYSYIPTPSGFETITYNTVINAKGETITYVTEGTPNGGSVSYSSSSQKGVNSSGSPVTYVSETLSNGETVSMTESTIVTPHG
jgi:hypothetical protein